jgi:hypothetical protein
LLAAQAAALVTSGPMLSGAVSRLLLDQDGELRLTTGTLLALRRTARSNMRYRLSRGSSCFALKQHQPEFSLKSSALGGMSRSRVMPLQSIFGQA